MNHAGCMEGRGEGGRMGEGGGEEGGAVGGRRSGGERGEGYLHESWSRSMGRSSLCYSIQRCAEPFLRMATVDGQVVGLKSSIMPAKETQQKRLDPLFFGQNEHFIFKKIQEWQRSQQRLPKALPRCLFVGSYQGGEAAGGAGAGGGAGGAGGAEAPVVHFHFTPMVEPLNHRWASAIRRDMNHPPRPEFDQVAVDFAGNMYPLDDGVWQYFYGPMLGEVRELHTFGPGPIYVMDIRDCNWGSDVFFDLDRGRIGKVPLWSLEPGGRLTPIKNAIKDYFEDVLATAITNVPKTQQILKKFLVERYQRTAEAGGPPLLTNEDLAVRAAEGVVAAVQRRQEQGVAPALVAQDAAVAARGRDSEDMELRISMSSGG